MNAGRLTHLVEISTPTQAPNDDGGMVTNWASLGPVWAAIEAATQSERFAPSTVVSGATHLITVRYLPNVTTAAKVEFKGRQFGIDGIDNVDERNEWLKLSCTEKVS